MKIRGFSAFLSILVWGSVAQGQGGRELSDDLELLLEEHPAEVVSSPSKDIQRRVESPAAVSVLTAEELRRFGYRTIAEALRGLAGFQVTNGRDSDFLGVRGVSLPGDFNTRVLVTLNGHTLNELWNNSSSLGEDLGLDIALVERIEVVRGPSSSLYGHGAFGAAVHITTKTGANLDWGRASAEVGSFGLARGAATIGKELKPGYSFLVNAWGLRRAGEPLYFPEYAQSPTGGFTPEGADRTNAYGFFGLARLGDFTLQGKYHRREQGLAFAPFRTLFADERNALQEARGFGEVRYERRWRPNGVLREAEVVARAYLDHYRFDDYLAYANGVPPRRPEYLFRDDGGADWYGAELRSVLDFGKWSRLLVGAEYQEAFRVRSRSYVPLEYYTRPPLGGEAPEVDISTPFTSAAVFVHDEVRPHNRVTVFAGLRFDHNSRFQRAFSPRGGLVIRTGEWASVKLLYGEGFRNPSTYEAFFDDGSDLAANPGLRAERIRTAEVVYEHRLREDLRLRAGFFYSRIEDLIRLATVDLDPRPDVVTLRRQFQNTEGLTQVVGGSARLSYRPEYGLIAYLAVSLQRARLEGVELPNSPGILVSAGMSAPLISDRLYAGLEAHLVGPRLAADLRTEVGAFFLLHLHLFTVQILEKLSISAKVYNLLDSSYGEIPGIERTLVQTVPGPRRTFMLKLDFDW
jgi:iron complex outermembrane receptor protein